MLVYLCVLVCLWLLVCLCLLVYLFAGLAVLVGWAVSVRLTKNTCTTCEYWEGASLWVIFYEIIFFGYDWMVGVYVSWKIYEDIFHVTSSFCDFTFN